MKLRSQEVRALAPENDPLKIGMGWSADDLSKPQILIESTFGDSHPGSAHLDQFVRESARAVNEHGGKAARYFATDMCDGIAQGHDGINYSLPHREAMVDLVEAQANASVYDGGVFIASCDKSVPAMLMSIGRLKDMSAIVVTGGVMEAHTLPKEYTVNDPACKINELLTLEQIGKFDAWEKTGVVPVPDKRLDVLAEMYHPKKVTPATIEFVDIAGLVKGASKGEGLGNKFLSHIRECDAIVHVVRCFEDENIIHVDGTVDPARDIDVIQLELVLADLETMQRRVEKANRLLKGGDKKQVQEVELGQRLLAHLEEGKPARTFSMTDEEKEIFHSWFLLTDKPVI